MTDLSILGLCGSLRKGSLNAAALRTCASLLPAGATLTIFDRLRDIPPYDEDEREKGFPDAVVALRGAIADADAVLIATPEYNHSVPGVLKNAIDWASRPPNVPLVSKSMAIFGASRGGLGSVRAQIHLRDILAFFDATVVQKPEVFIGTAHEKIAADGTLHDAPTRDFLSQLLAALCKQTHAMRRPGVPA